MTEKMKAVAIRAVGVPLEIIEANTPSSCGENEVVIRNRAVGVNLIDTLIQDGKIDDAVFQDKKLNSVLRDS